MGYEATIRKNVRANLGKDGNEKVAILPLRPLAGTVGRVLDEELGTRERFVVDNYAYDMEHVFPMDRMPEGYGECTFLVAAFGGTKETLVKALRDRVPKERIVDLLFDEEREKVFRSDEKVRLDFLCPGFPKCGTTSLHNALTQNPRIFLPEGKETLFLSSHRHPISDATHGVFKKNYPLKARGGVLVGDIEPSYYNLARDACRYFGEKLKIVFCVRNPAHALYSFFKMTMRSGGISESLEEALMEEFGRVCPEMFEKWLAQDWQSHLYRYVDYVKAYLEHFPMEQVKIIVSEELFGDPSGQMDELQAFLGIPQKDRVAYSAMPWAYIGNKVAKNKESLKLRRQVGELRMMLRMKCDMESFRMANEVQRQLGDMTLADYNEPMLPETHRRLMDYYMDSIHGLEDLMGRSLKGIWYQ